MHANRGALATQKGVFRIMPIRNGSSVSDFTERVRMALGHTGVLAFLNARGQCMGTTEHRYFQEQGNTALHTSVVAKLLRLLRKGNKIEGTGLGAIF